MNDPQQQSPPEVLGTEGLDQKSVDVLQSVAHVSETVREAWQHVGPLPFFDQFKQKLPPNNGKAVKHVTLVDGTLLTVYEKGAIWLRAASILDQPLQQGEQFLNALQCRQLMMAASDLSTFNDVIEYVEMITQIS